MGFEKMHFSLGINFQRLHRHRQSELLVADLLVAAFRRRIARICEAVILFLHFSRR